MRYHFQFMSWRRVSITVSAVLLLLSIASLAVRGLNFGIDFTGGVVMDITTPHAQSTGDVSAVLAAQLISGAQVQATSTAGEAGRTFEMRLPPMTHPAEQALEGALAAKFQTTTTALVQTVNYVTPTIGRQLADRAILAVLIATALMTAYLGIRFQVGEAGVYSGLKFALASVIALLHDILLTVGVFSFFHLTVDSNFVAAVLTIYGYAMNDKVIVFDRVRERLRERRREPLAQLINISLNQVLNRTVVTVATVLLALLSVYVLGGVSTRVLALALIIGVCFGTYSSVFIASPIFLWLAGRGGGVGAGRAAARPARA